jgi:hypothetical protein
MPKLQRIDGKVKHYAYTPEGKRQYELDKAAMKMSPTAKLPSEAGSGTGSGTYTPPKPTEKPRRSSRIVYANTPKPSTTKPKGQRKVRTLPTAKEYRDKMALRENIRKGKTRTRKY